MTTISEAVATHAQHASVMPPSPQQDHLTDAPHSSHATDLNTSSQTSISSSSASNRPQHLTLSTSDVSSSAENIVLPRDDSTTPTSALSSLPDSQDMEPPEYQAKKSSAVDIIKQEAVQEQRAGSGSQSPDPNALSGTKRTATGDLKRSSVNGLADIINTSNDIRHSRTSSMVSDGSSTGNVHEISQQLRTRLKYAMLKVQNGWQARNFDEIESLASQSPRSTVSGFHHFGDPSLLSPRAVMTRKYQRESSESDSSESVVTVENRSLTNQVTSPTNPSRRALAPPLDLIPSSRRRPTPNAAYHKANGPQTQARHLPSLRPVGNQRTPSQNAVLEADAVETLLFMASPNNSGYNPPTRSSQESTTNLFYSQTSPLRAQFSQTSMTSPKRVAFATQASRSGATLDKAAIIDRILDEMSDDSDDDSSLERAFEMAERSKPASGTTLTI